MVRGCRDVAWWRHVRLLLPGYVTLAGPLNNVTYENFAILLSTNIWQYFDIRYAHTYYKTLMGKLCHPSNHVIAYIRACLASKSDFILETSSWRISRKTAYITYE